MIGKVIVNKALEKKMQENRKEQRDFWIAKPFAGNLPYCILVDIDGTLAIRGDRGIYDFKRAEVDNVCEQVRHFVHLVSKEKVVDAHLKLDIIIFSGREDTYKEETKRWLKKHDIPYDGIHMRVGGDKRNDAIVKREMYEKYIREKYNVFFVIDDRARVVRMWRSLGLFVFDVNQTGIEY